MLSKATHTFIAGALALSLFAVPLAHAQMKGSFDAADTNHDGRVTLQEFDAYATQRLMASNGMMAQRFRQLSPQQQAARLKARFDAMDSGNKGYLTRDDWHN